MLKTTRKLSLNKEKIRTLVDENLERAAGGRVGGTTNCGRDSGAWCSSGNINKCFSEVAINVQCYAR